MFRAPPFPFVSVSWLFPSKFGILPSLIKRWQKRQRGICLWGFSTWIFVCSSSWGKVTAQCTCSVCRSSQPLNLQWLQLTGIAGCRVGNKVHHFAKTQGPSRLRQLYGKKPEFSDRAKDEGPPGSTLPLLQLKDLRYLWWRSLRPRRAFSE